jgi:hypothetical protein
MSREIGQVLKGNHKIYMGSSSCLCYFADPVFKSIYPYPNMVLDSYYYTIGAITHATVSPWAIGYSWFLRAVGTRVSFSPLSGDPTVSIVTDEPISLVFDPGSLLSPSGEYPNGYCLCSSLSTRYSCILRELHHGRCALHQSEPGLDQSLTLDDFPASPRTDLDAYGICILLVFAVRYNSLYYPIVAAAAFLLSRYNRRQKALGIGLQLAVIGGFIFYTSFQIREISGQPQFSPFGNWKIANDALYMYGHIYPEKHDPVPERFSVLDHVVRESFQKAGGRVDDLLNYQSPFYGSIYMFFNTSPLVQYKNLLYGEDTEFVNFKKMAYVGPLYGSYGAWLIRKYPLDFARYFVGPNAVRYLFPPMEAAFVTLSPFVLRQDYLGHAGKSWFGVKTLWVGWSRINLRNTILAPYQILVAVIHLLFVISLAGFFILKGSRSITKLQLSGLCVLGTLWLFDLGFNLIAAATVMRYELFLLLIEFSLVLWLSERIYTDEKIEVI